MWSRRSDLDKELEILILRLQLSVLQRQFGRRVLYRPTDRFILADLGRTLSRIRWRSFLVTPHTPAMAARAGGKALEALEDNGGVVAQQWHPSWPS